MKKYDPGCLSLQDKLDDLARVHARAVNGSAEEFHTLDDLMPLVDEH